VLRIEQAEVTQICRLRTLRSLRQALTILCLFTLTIPSAHGQMAPGLQMLLGNPDRATANPSNRQRFLIQRPQYALSYNDDLRHPNWVAWHLSRQDIGSVERGQFQPDRTLPAGFTQVMPTDYSRSGYDRGHNCPSKDRSATRHDNDAVFVMSNITPQQHGMNAGPWERLESYCRDLVARGNELYIYCGHGFDGPKGKTLGRNAVAVPDFGWKIVLVLPEQPGNDLARITPTTRVIAVRMPNISTISKQDWREFCTSVDDIEKATGLSFFDTLPKSIAEALKNRVDFDMSSPKYRVRSGATSGAGSVDLSSGKPGTSDTSGTVWVNTRSGLFWRPGTPYYGKTKQGKYMTEKEALAAGYRPAKGP
jgi:endonuclease G, mitochondrial